MAKYRPNVCIVVRKVGTDQVLLCHRKGFPADAGWQFPQGGLHRGASLLAEMRRELEEETGIRDVEVVEASESSYTYEFPEGLKLKHQEYAGQTQRWVLVDFPGSDDTISFSREPAEFDSWCWVSARTALDRIVDFKKATYTRALADLGLIQNP